jgi:hypothetical protein
MNSQLGEAPQTARRLRPPREAGIYLGNTAPQTLAKWRVYGTGPEFIKLNGRIFYEETALDAFINQRRRRSTSETV